MKLKTSPVARLSLKQIVVIILIISISYTLPAQEIQPTLIRNTKWNSIYLSSSIDVVNFSLDYGIFCDRKILDELGYKKNQSLWLGIGYSEFLGFFGDGDEITLHGTYVWSNPKGHNLEFDFGFFFKFDRDLGPPVSTLIGNGHAPGFSNEVIDMSILPFGTCGYRYQKPGGRFLAKFNFGFPDLLTIGAGMSF